MSNFSLETLHADFLREDDDPLKGHLAEFLENEANLQGYKLHKEWMHPIITVQENVTFVTKNSDGTFDEEQICYADGNSTYLHLREINRNIVDALEDQMKINRILIEEVYNLKHKRK